MSNTYAPSQTDKIYELMHTVGRAIMLTKGNNTHSGNLSMRDPQDRDVFYITSSGSQKGMLVPSDIVPLKFSGVSWGDGRASTESTIHRKVLSLPGVEATIHAHYLSAISISFDSRECQNYLVYEGKHNNREEYSFVPIDCLGASILHKVPTGEYLEAVGSIEMEERIPEYLISYGATIVKGHGPFVRGKSLEECLFLQGLVDSSAKLHQAAGLRGVDVASLSRRLLHAGVDSVYAKKPKDFSQINLGQYETKDESTISAFKDRAYFNYYQGITPFGTGSMSEKITEREMLYCPLAGAPEGLELNIRRVSLNAEKNDDWELRFHKIVYKETSNKTCMITMSPLASAEAMAVIAESYGMEALLDPSSVTIDYSHRKDHPVIVPIDAEAVYLNPRVGLCNSNAPDEAVLDMLRWHKGACFVAGMGAIGIGKVTLEQAAHHIASGESIARFRQSVHMTHKIKNGPPIEYFEPKTQ
jgi:L-fuculose-phosphate aldolase